MQLLCARECRAREVRGVERGPLVGVLAIAQHRLALPCLTEPGRKALTFWIRRNDIAHPGGNRDVVGRRVRERFRCQALTLRQREATLPQGRDDIRVAIR